MIHVRLQLPLIKITTQLELDRVTVGMEVPNINKIVVKDNTAQLIWKSIGLPRVPILTSKIIYRGPRLENFLRLIRGCTDLPPPMVEAQPCSTGSSPMVQYKDCKVACDPRVEGNSCNNNLVDVSMRFASDKPVSSCFACEFYENPDG